jgi:hypothetical protein
LQPGKRGKCGCLAGIHPDLTEASHHVVGGRNPSELVARNNGNGGSLLSGSLALRLAGRSSSALATYHRCPVPKRWEQSEPKLAELYAAGIRGSWFSEAGLGMPQEGTAKRIRRQRTARTAAVPVLFLDQTNRTTPRAGARSAVSAHPIVGVVHRGEGNNQTTGSACRRASSRIGAIFSRERNEDAWTLKGYTRGVALRASRQPILGEDLQRWLPEYRAQIRPASASSPSCTSARRSFPTCCGRISAELRGRHRDHLCR